MEKASKIHIIIGLGNEGDEYAKTYHNVGSFIANRLQAQEVLPSSRFFQLSGFMNNIGVPVRQFIKKSNTIPAETLVIHDETDLPIGEYRLSFGGGSAGHKGIKSIIENLGTEEFWRLRIGVRDSNEKIRRKAEEFVLQHWSSADEKIFIGLVDLAWQEMIAKNLA